MIKKVIYQKKMVKRADMIKEISICCLLFLLFFPACRSKQKREGLAKDTLVIGIARDWRVSDVWSHKGFNCLIFETLVSRNKKGDFVPLLAESWEVSDDSQEYTFHLRKGLTFSDGTLLNAQLVKESFGWREKVREKRKKEKEKRGKERSVKTNFSAVPPTVKFEKNRKYEGNGRYERKGWFNNETYNLPRWSPIEAIEVKDEYTLSFHLKQPYTLFLEELATTHSSPILKPSEDEKVCGFIGTGPYTIVEHQRTQYLKFTQNPHYWQGKVNVPNILFKVIPDPQTRVITLEAGDIDMTGIDGFAKIPLEMVPQLKENAGLTMIQLAHLEPTVSYLVCNYQKEPFTDIRVRKAVCLSIDREKIDEIIHFSARTLDGPLPKDHSLYSPQVAPRRKNIEEAGQLLAQAGWKDSDGDGFVDKGGEKFSITLSFNYFDPIYKILGEILQAQFKETGLEVNLQYLEIGAHIEEMRNKTFDLAFWPQMRYHMFYYSQHPSWLNVYQSKELDEAFSDFLHSNDPEKVRAGCRKTQEIISESFVLPFFFEIYTVAAWNKNSLSNFDPLPLSWNMCMEIWKASLL